MLDEKDESAMLATWLVELLGFMRFVSMFDAMFSKTRFKAMHAQSFDLNHTYELAVAVLGGSGSGSAWPVPLSPPTLRIIHTLLFGQQPCQ